MGVAHPKANQPELRIQFIYLTIRELLIVSAVDVINVRRCPIVWPTGESDSRALSCAFIKCQLSCGFQSDASGPIALTERHRLPILVAFELVFVATKCLGLLVFFHGNVLAVIQMRRFVVLVICCSCLLLALSCMQFFLIHPYCGLFARSTDIEYLAIIRYALPGDACILRCALYFLLLNFWLLLNSSQSDSCMHIKCISTGYLMQLRTHKKRFTTRFLKSFDYIATVCFSFVRTKAFYKNLSNAAPSYVAICGIICYISFSIWVHISAKKKQSSLLKSYTQLGLSHLIR